MTKKNSVVQAETEQFSDVYAQENPADVQEARDAALTYFKTLYHQDVGEHIEKKNTGKATLSYLSWPWAWAEIIRHYPDATYEIEKDENRMPYFAGPLGIMVYTKLTIQGITREMWLPVMDGANNAMKTEPYTISSRFGDKTVNAATMFDVNKTLMRCLVKNIAMFGLGLYIYAGEDLPEESEDDRLAKQAEAKKVADTIGEIDQLVKARTASMAKEDKLKFANEVIVPIIGSANYRICKELDKLNQLLSKLKAMV